MIILIISFDGRDAPLRIPGIRRTICKMTRNPVHSMCGIFYEVVVDLEIKQRRRRVKGRRVYGGIEIELSKKTFFIESELAHELFLIEEDESNENMTIFDIIGGSQNAEAK